MFNFLPQPVAFEIPLSLISPNLPNIPIYWYGILIVTGALAGAYLATLEARRRGLDPDHVWNALLFALVLGVVGARAYHVISDLAQNDPLGYLGNPLAMINPRTGGLGIYGAVAGGMLGMYIYTRYAKLRYWEWVDIAVPGLVLGQAIGRWGNFMNQELYGWPTTLPWGIPIDAAHRLPIFGDLTQYPVETTRFHPTFLYESLGLVVITIGLVYITRKYSSALLRGDMFLLYAVFYPVLRFFTEMQRPDAWKISGVPAAQIIAVASAVVAIVWLAYRHTGPAPAKSSPTAARRRARSGAGQARTRGTSRTAVPPGDKPQATMTSETKPAEPAPNEAESQVAAETSSEPKSENPL